MADERDDLIKAVNKIGAAGSELVAAPDSEAKSIADKNKMIQEYNDAQKPKAPEPARPASNAKVDKVNPGAKYGSRSGEKRIDTSEMTKKLPSYKEGTDRVPSDQVAVLHKDEAVVPKHEADKQRSGKHNVSLYRAMHHLNKGGLHRALGVPEGEKIPADKLAAAKRSNNEHVRKMAQFASTMGHFKH